MKATATSSPKVSPILGQHLGEVGRFLNEHMNREFSPQRWVESVTHRWAVEVPNYGMQLRDGDRLVGVLLATYSDQLIAGRVEHFCNPHSWCVLESYRRHGIGLVLQLVRQAGYHYTMFTPNPKVTEVFRGLKFKELNARLRVFPNLPTWRTLRPGSFAVSEPEQISFHLRGTALAEHEAHCHIPWLRFAAFGDAERACLAIYKPVRLKRIPVAWVMHLSDSAVFVSLGALLRQHLLGKGFAGMRIEERWLPPGGTGISLRMERSQPKLFMSKTLSEAQIRDAYSELMSLDV